MTCDNVVEIFNPKGIPYGGEMAGLEVTYDVEQLVNVFNYSHVETNNSLFGSDSIGGRSLLVYNLENMEPIACGAIIYKN